VATFVIDRLTARCRLRPGASGPLPRARLGALLARLEDGGLERELERAGLPEGEEVVIRHLRVPARLRMAGAEAGIVAGWGSGVAEAVRETIERGGPDVVRYGSRHHALVDVVTGVAAGDLARTWAWRRLGLWGAPERVGERAAAAELCRVLCAEPAALVAALRAAAESGWLPALMRGWSAAQWAVLAEAALLQVGGAPELLSGNGTRGAPGGGGQAGRADRAGNGGPLELRAAALREGSLLGAAAADPALDGGVRRALAVLALADVEPLALGEPGATALIRAVVDGAYGTGAGASDPDGGHATVADADRTPGDGTHSAGTGGPGAERAARGETGAGGYAAARGDRGESMAGQDGWGAGVRAAVGAVDAASAARGAQGLPSAPPAPGAPGANRGQTAPASAASEATREGRAGGAAGSAPQATGEWDASAGVAAPPPAAPSRSPAEADPGGATARDPRDGAGRDPGFGLDAPPAASNPAFERPLPSVRRRGHTAWGGLLFLVHVLGDDGVALALGRSRALAARPLRWRLHRLALALAPLDAADPAALAFAGLRPDAPPPSAGEPPAMAAEVRALARLATRTHRALHARLGGQADLAPSALTHALCRRPAEVLSDPGWFELRLSVDDVSTEVRRAGLDLDPGWVPWLGAVVRFTYA